MEHGRNSNSKSSLNRTAVSATLHCLTGCATGEVLGMVIGTSLGWGTWTTISVSVGLAFIFGYSLTLLPLLRSGIAVGMALSLAFASDTISITLMEIIDNLIMVLIPGAMSAGPTTPLFWTSMILSLGLAALTAFPVIRWMIARGRGHTVVHQYHNHNHHQDDESDERDGNIEETIAWDTAAHVRHH